MSLILSETDLWEGRSLSEITPVEYEGLMASDVINATNHALKNCSLTRLVVSRWLFLTISSLILGFQGIDFSWREMDSLFIPCRELDQAAQGTGLAFIVMADVFTKLPGSVQW